MEGAEAQTVCRPTLAGTATWRTCGAWRRTAPPPESAGTARRGGGLLSGLVVCGRCGLRLGRSTGRRRPVLQCAHHLSRGTERACCGIQGGRGRRPGRREVLERGAGRDRVEPARDSRYPAMSVTLWISTGGRLERPRQVPAQRRRQYDAVEPENRLVARTLEQRWEEACGSSGSCRRSTTASARAAAGANRGWSGAPHPGAGRRLPALWQAARDDAGGPRRRSSAAWFDVSWSSAAGTATAWVRPSTEHRRLHERHEVHLPGEPLRTDGRLRGSLGRVIRLREEGQVHRDRGQTQ